MSFEGHKFSYVTSASDPRNIDDDVGGFEWHEGLVLRYDPISEMNDIKWKGSLGLSREVMTEFMRAQPNIDFEVCPHDDPLWTDDATAAWNLYSDGSKSPSFVTHS